MSPLLAMLIPHATSLLVSIAKETNLLGKEERDELLQGELGDGLKNIGQLVADMRTGEEVDLKGLDIPESFAEKMEEAGHGDILAEARARRDAESGEESDSD